MILAYTNKLEIVWFGGYLRNFCLNFGKKMNFGQNLDFIEFRPKFWVEREFWPNRNRNQKSSFRFRYNRNRNTNLNFGFGFLLSKIRSLCSLAWQRQRICCNRNTRQMIKDLTELCHTWRKKYPQPPSKTNFYTPHLRAIMSYCIK